MIIKNKRKLIRGILIILGITLSLIILMTSQTLSHQEVKYKSVSVISGDTLWNIAEKEQKYNTYYEGNDIRDIISDIKAINSLTTNSLKVNQILEIPTY